MEPPQGGPLLDERYGWKRGGTHLVRPRGSRLLTRKQPQQPLR
jgi:hypothetical protein